MQQEWILNGKRVTPQETAAALLKNEGVGLISGAPVSGASNVTGYSYPDGHVDSFGQIFSAAAIRMTDGQSIDWEVPVGPQYAAAPGGLVLVFEYAMGNGAAFPQPNGYFELSANDRRICFSMKKHNSLFSADGIRLYFELKRTRFAHSFGESFSLDSFAENESAYVNGTAYLFLPHDVVAGQSVIRLSVSAHPQNGEISRRWFRVGFGLWWLMGVLENGVNCVLHGVPRPAFCGQNFYFGDIHVHTAQTGVLNGDGCGVGSVASNLKYARDVSLLDFCAISDHDWQLDAADWKLLRDTNDQFNEDGRFVALHAYEWTSPTYGHRNVYFRNGSEIPDDLKPFNCQAEPFKFVKYGQVTDHDPNPEALWDWLEHHELTAMTIPHHPNSEQFVMDLDRYYNETYDRCIEVYSSWGTVFEDDHPLNLCSERIPGYGYARYSGKKHFGFVASSDGHDGNAGDANVARYKRHLAHYAGSGRVAVFCDGLSRGEIFDAIHARHCYAVTGEPILLYFSIGSAMMGDLLCTPGKQTFYIAAEATLPVTHVKLYCNGKIIDSAPVDGSKKAGIPPGN